MNILIDKVRIKNFRSLFEVEVDLQPLTLLVGTNNAGKTSFLRALNTVLGTSRSALNLNDLFIDSSGTVVSQSITIDIRIIPFSGGQRKPLFDDADYGLFGGAENVQSEVKDGVDMQFYAFRAVYTFTTDDTPIAEYRVINIWEDEAVSNAVVVPISTIRDHLVLYFIDAQRDISDDLKLRTSYFGKQTAEAHLPYFDKKIPEKDQKHEVKEVEVQLQKFNNEIVENSEVLSNLAKELSNLNTNENGKITIVPLPSRMRDLHKGMRIEYKDGDGDAFSMEYHGMGTRSWASMLSFGAYVNWETKKRANYYAVLALEEPEAHLHPNAQRALYGQLTNFKGQKIVSTHSPYIVAQAELESLLFFSKKSDRTSISFIQNIDAMKAHQKNALKRFALRKQGEILFSKVVVLAEGETEECLLNILADKYFDNKTFDLGITIFGCGGSNYKYFMQILAAAHIPYFVFSDYDKNEVQTTVNKAFTSLQLDSNSEKLIKLNTNIENYLLENGFENELKIGAENFIMDYYSRMEKRNEMKENINNIEGDNGLKWILDKFKAKIVPFYAETVVTKPLPPALQTLFERIATTIHYTKKQ